MTFANELILSAQALFPQPLYRDLIQFKDNIRITLDQCQHYLTRTLPPVVAGVIGVLYLFALGVTLMAADY